MDIETIRAVVQEKGYRITGHASVEATKDGISPADIRYAIFHGKIIESYWYDEQPEMERYLIQATLPTHLPLHVVVELIVKSSVVVITAYVPDRRKWVSFQKRKHDRGQK
jgi:hypothetical protein